MHGNVIHLRYATNPREWPAATLSGVLARLPAPARARAGRYRRWQDRQAGLLGRLLLLDLAAELLPGVAPLERLATDAYGRPYLDGVGDFDFNISHTEGFVACAAVRGPGRVGVDVEWRRDVDPTEFDRVFTDGERRHLRGAADRTAEFYRLWTRKEAVMKVDGRGFYLDPRGIDALAATVRIDDRTYGVRPLDLHPAVTTHVACAGTAWSVNPRPLARPPDPAP